LLRVRPKFYEVFRFFVQGPQGPRNWPIVLETRAVVYKGSLVARDFGFYGLMVVVEVLEKCIFRVRKLSSGSFLKNAIFRSELRAWS
jgi:hypothetical protein